MNIKLLIIRFFLLAGIFAVQLGFGWIYTRKILREKELYLILPLSIIIGTGIYTVLLNLISYIVPVTISFYLVLGILFLFSLIIYVFSLKKKTPNIEIGLHKANPMSSILSLAIILLLGFFTDIGISNFYEEFSRAIIATISRGNFPVKYPWAPDFTMQYHYGPHLFAAAVNKISGFEVYWVLDIISFIFTGATFLMLFGLIKNQTESTTAALLSTLLFFFSGWLMWIKLFRGLTYVPLPSTPHLHIPDNSIWQYIVAFFTRLSYLQPSDPFSLGELYGFMYQKNHLPSLFGFPTFFCLVYLLLKESSGNSRSNYSYISFITILFLLPFLALVDESKFCLFILALPIYFVIDAILFKSFDYRLFFFILLMIFISLIFASLQGGYLPQFIFGGTNDSGSNLVTLSSLKLWIRFGISSYRYSYMSIGSIGWLSFYAELWGIYFLLGPIILYFVHRNKIKIGIFLSLVGVMGFILPQVIFFPWVGQSLIRVTHVYVLLFGILLGILLTQLIKSFRSGFLAKAIWPISLIIMLLTSGSTLLFIIRSVETKPVYYQETPELDREVCLWMRKNLPAKSRVLAEDYSLITRLTGLFVPAMIPKYSIRKEYTEAINSLDLDSLRKLKIDYIYLSKGWYERLPSVAKAFLRNPKYCEEIFSLSSLAQSNDWRKVYRFYYRKSP